MNNQVKSRGKIVEFYLLQDSSIKQGNFGTGGTQVLHKVIEYHSFTTLHPLLYPEITKNLNRPLINQIRTN